ncbi:Hypothetical_protein [Hexamita inflata]|uniref:Hypothetical_protein n=1 Tax=Hexamita inflata TaxID=28002 RepID=A0AA86N7B8_9EUKA|nr:Hypothetical protein HINF_LOCUS1689 [Hexamita inflata]CAI9914056.1 Hypothetical protein HINF_LOCUS1701 [Hexamita inflata]
MQDDRILISDKQGYAEADNTYYQQNDYISIFSLRLFENINGATGSIRYFCEGLTFQTINIINQNFYNLQDFADYINTLYETNSFKLVVENNVLKITEISKIELYVVLTGNLYKFFGCGPTGFDMSSYFTKSILTTKYYQLISKQVNGSLTVKNADGSIHTDNALVILHPSETQYTSRNMEVHNLILQNGPLQFQLYDDLWNTVDVDYVLQIRLFEKESFQLKPDGTEAPYNFHQKQQLYILLDENNNKENTFYLSSYYKYISLVYLYGQIGTQTAATDIVLGYIYELALNDKDFTCALSFKREINGINNNIFCWQEQITKTNQLKLQLKIKQIAYNNQGSMERNEVTNQMPSILLKLYVK